MCDPFHIICLNAHNDPGPPMVIEVIWEQRCEVRITGSLVRGWILAATLAGCSSCFNISFHEILLTVQILIVHLMLHLTHIVWMERCYSVSCHNLVHLCRPLSIANVIHSMLWKWNTCKISCVKHILTCHHVTSIMCLMCSRRGLWVRALHTNSTLCPVKWNSNYLDLTVHFYYSWGLTILSFTVCHRGH